MPHEAITVHIQERKRARSGDQENPAMVQKQFLFDAFDPGFYGDPGPGNHPTNLRFASGTDAGGRHCRLFLQWKYYERRFFGQFICRGMHNV
jgi:hypothetical protein